MIVDSKSKSGTYRTVLTQNGSFFSSVKLTWIISDSQERSATASFWILKSPNSKGVAPDTLIYIVSKSKYELSIIKMWNQNQKCARKLKKRQHGIQASAPPQVTFSSPSPKSLRFFSRNKKKKMS